MRKFYLILAFIAVGLTTFAAAKKDLRSFVQPTPEIANVDESIQNVMTDYDIPSEDLFGTRSFTDSNGNLNILIFYQQGRLDQFLSGTATNRPFWGVKMICRTQDIKTGTLLNDATVLLCWPTRYTWDDAKTFLNDPLPLEQQDTTIVPFDEFWEGCMEGSGPKGFKARRATEGTGSYTYTAKGDNSHIEYYGIFSISTTTTGGTANGIEIPKSTPLTNDAAIICTSREEDPEGTQYTFNVNLAYETGNNIKMNYTGTVFADVEGGTTRISIDKLYLFNAGVKDGASDDEMTFYPVMEWGPYQQLYIGACGEDLKVGVSKDNVGDGSFDISKMQGNFRNDDAPFTRVDQFNYVLGMLMAPEDIDLKAPYGVWTIGQPTLEGRVQKITPEAWMAFPAGIEGTAWSGNYTSNLSDKKYGLGGVVWQYYRQFKSGQIALGNSKNGFELRVKTQYNGTVEAACNNPIKLYVDPSDILTYSEIKSNGGTTPTILDPAGVETITGDVENADIKAANGLITIIAANDANVYVYSINGALINASNVKAGATKNIAVEKGVYVVKVGNKTTKVIL